MRGLDAVIEPDRRGRDANFEERWSFGGRRRTDAGERWWRPESAGALLKCALHVDAESVDGNPAGEPFATDSIAFGD